MMTWNEREYFRKRAEIERALAKLATDPRVAPVHQELAERYEALVREGKRPTLHVVAAKTAEAARKWRDPGVAG
jgi:transposase